MNGNAGPIFAGRTLGSADLDPGLDAADGVGDSGQMLRCPGRQLHASRDAAGMIERGAASASLNAP
jgi:hypothetical protein